MYRLITWIRLTATVQEYETFLEVAREYYKNVEHEFQGDCCLVVKKDGEEIDVDEEYNKLIAKEKGR